MKNPQLPGNCGFLESMSFMLLEDNLTVAPGLVP